MPEYMPYRRRRWIAHVGTRLPGALTAINIANGTGFMCEVLSAVLP